MTKRFPSRLGSFPGKERLSLAQAEHRRFRDIPVTWSMDYKECVGKELERD